MKGDIIDAKQVLKTALLSVVFTDSIATLLAEKALFGLTVPNPIAIRGVTVYTNERLTKLLFPMCELLGYNTTYPSPDSSMKEAKHKIGLRWTVLEKDEETATLAAELLCIATVNMFWNEENDGLLQDTTLNAAPVVVTEEDYSPLLPDSKGAFLKGGVVIMELTTLRTNTV